MAEGQCLRVKRCGLKGSITKLMEKVEEALTAELETMSTESIHESRRVPVSTTVEQLKSKLAQITELDEAIAKTNLEEEELEAEICNADTYQSNLEQQVALLVEFIKKASQSPRTRPPTPPPSVNDAPRLISTESTTTTEPEVTAATLPETEVVKKTLHSDTASAAPVSSHTSYVNEHTRGMHQTYTRLPKLPLPTFDGNPLQWQTFWDSFSAAVDSNLYLMGIQKFNYLRAQLKGDASRVISGFPLSNNNYSHSVKLLKERFGQNHKLVEAHMDALLNVLPPSNNLETLQTFYDTLQGHIRALSALGESSQSYGALLTTSVLRKLHPSVKMNMARDHYNTKWTIDELLTRVLKEIHIFEAGLPTGHNHSDTRGYATPTTASFYTDTYKTPQTHDILKRDPVCVFCKGMHKTSSCTSVTSPQERLDIVKSAGLCFNCLTRHKVSQCTSKFSCRECLKKRHTSLCHVFTTNVEAPPPNQSQPEPVPTPTEFTLSSTNSTMTSTNSTATSSFTTMTPAPLSAFYTSVCLLKTAIADVSANSTTVEGHILFDEGAQCSFITQQLADTLQLQPIQHELITVSSFGEQISMPTRFAVTTISIHTLNGSQIPMSVLIVPKLAAPVRNSIRTHLNQFSYLQGLTLAHPVTSDENFSISVLIGADYYWQFIQDHVVRGDGPTAVQSRLGYLLSGPLPLSQPTSTTSLHISILSCTTENARDSSPIDTQFCSSEVFSKNETPAVTCDIYSVTTCMKNNIKQLPVSRSTTTLVTTSAVNSNEDNQNCSSMLSERFSEAYYPPNCQPKTEVLSPSPYNLPVGGHYPALPQKAYSSLNRIPKQTLSVLCWRMLILVSSLTLRRPLLKLEGGAMKSATTTALITCKEAKRGQHKIRTWIDLLRAPLEDVQKT